MQGFKVLAIVLGGLGSVFFSSAFAQVQDTVQLRLSRLGELFASIYQVEASQRWTQSDSFSSYAYQVLQEYEGEYFPFPKIKGLNYFQAEDGSFRMLNWGVPDDNGTVQYRALLEVKRKTKGDYIIYDMHDMSLYQPYPEQSLLDPSQWWGAFYYTCIENKIGGRTFYTFLGWNTGQPLYQQSVIEVMQIKNNGDVVFGASVFSNRFRLPGTDRIDRHIKDNDVKRVVFRFGKKTGMILRYDYQTYIVENQNGKKVRKKENMIVFDKLMPSQSAMADDYSYYIPVGGDYQAYVFLDGRWRLQTNIDARNPEPKKRR